jgi:hypothetical protein
MLIWVQLKGESHAIQRLTEGSAYRLACCRPSSGSKRKRQLSFHCCRTLKKRFVENLMTVEAQDQVHRDQKGHYA